MLYSNLKIFDKHGLFADGTLAVKDGLFALSDEKASDEFAGLYALPGYVDVHTHGALKLDFEDCNVDEALRMLNFYACAGTLYIMPTIGTVEFEHICNAADTILAAAEKIKEEKLKRFGADIYVSPSTGLVAFVETRYKFFLFGKSLIYI